MFCKTVWNGMFILPDGYIRLCSLGRYADPALDFQRARDKNGTPMHILTHELNEIMNSDKHREVRLLNKENPTSWSPHCDCCEVREKVATTNNNSRRIFLRNVSTGHVDHGVPLQYLEQDGSVPWMPSSLDINFGNLCNQKCVMCNPAFSNQWYNEWFDYWKTDTFGQSIPIKANFNSQLNKWEDPDTLRWHENPLWWEKFEQMAPYLRHIYVTGGEPMVTPSHDEMLDRLIDRGFAENIWLEYDTNCTAINHKIISKWEKFKKVILRASMDGTNEKYEIIRYPGKWNVFDKNIKVLKQLMIDSNKKITVNAITSCFQIINSFDQVDSEEYCNEVGIPYHIRFLEGPMFMSTESLNDEAKKYLIDFYSTKTTQKAPIIVSYLNNRLGKGKLDRVEEFIKFMNYLDKTRNTDWKKVFPNVSELINKFYI